MSILSTYLARRKVHPFGQFGQSNDVLSRNGKIGCGHTCVQSLASAFRGVVPTHDGVARLMGYSGLGTRQGTSAAEVARALKHWFTFTALGIRRPIYRATTGLSFAELLKATAKGPVILVVPYRLYPNWRGYRGVARPAPYAAPLGKAGANQFPKPAILHWVVLAGVMPAGSAHAGRLAVMEPNHASPARPEKVVIDYIARADLERAYRAGGSIAIRPVRSVA